MPKKMTPEDFDRIKRDVAESLAEIKHKLPPNYFDDVMTFIRDTEALGERGKEYPYVVSRATTGGPAVADVVKTLGVPVWSYPFVFGDMTTWAFGTIEARDAFVARWGGTPRGKGVDFE